jgi:carbon-monoxide dehydrogenase medium subunit
VKPPPFLYLRPETLDEALTQLAEHGDEAKVLAGGQSLVPLLNFRLARPTVLIDLNLVRELTQLGREDGVLRVGAMVRQRTAERAAEVAEACPLIPRALHHVGHVQIRYRGTIGGSFAHADPAAELPAVSLVTGAEIVARSVRGHRTIAADGFFLGPFTTALEPDEILTEVRFGPTDGARVAFIEMARRVGDFALGGVAAVVRFGDGSTVSDVRLAALGMGAEPHRLAEAEAAVRGRAITDEVRRDAAAAASRESDPLGDVHADAEYRRELVGVLVARALKEVTG